MLNKNLLLNVMTCICGALNYLPNVYLCLITRLLLLRCCTVLVFRCIWTWNIIMLPFWSVLFLLFFFLYFQLTNFNISLHAHIRIFDLSSFFCFKFTSHTKKINFVTKSRMQRGQNDRRQKKKLQQNHC